MEFRIHPENELILIVRQFELEDELRMLDAQFDRNIAEERAFRRQHGTETDDQHAQNPEYQRIQAECQVLNKLWFYLNTDLHRIETLRSLLQIFIRVMNNDLQDQDIRKMRSCMYEFRMLNQSGDAVYEEHMNQRYDAAQFADEMEDAGFEPDDYYDNPFDDEL